MKHAVRLLLLVVGFWACQKEIEGSIGSGNNTPVRKCTGCNFLPVCDSAKLSYVDSSAVGVDTLTSTLMILGDTTVNGKKFTRVSPFAVFPQGLLYNCNGGDYRVFQPVPNLGLNVDSLLQALGLPGGQTLPSKIETTILKSGAAAGATWSDTVAQLTVVPLPPIKATVKLDYKLEEKGVQRTVLGKTYNNVIHVSSTPNVSVPLVPPMPLGVSVDTYYADGVGLIESRTTSGGVVQNVIRLREP